MTDIKNNAKPFFNIVMQGLKGEVEGSDFWSSVDENAVFEFSYQFPNLPQTLIKEDYIKWFENYDNILEWAGNLKTYKDSLKGVIILDYEVKGKSSIGKPYHNRFCSIVKIQNKKIIHWTDFADTYSASQAMIE